MAIRWRVSQFFRYSGITFIYRKFRPKNDQILPTGFIWLIGIYVALYGLASQRFENRVDIIETRLSSVITLMGSPSRRTAIGLLPKIQKMKCPVEPKIWNPIQTLSSFLGKEARHVETVAAVKDIIEGMKSKLDSVDLRQIDLSNANLVGANFRGSDLRKANFYKAELRNANIQGIIWNSNFFGADLHNAKLDSVNLWATIIDSVDFSKASLLNVQGISAVGFEKVYTLYETKLDSPLQARLNDMFPELMTAPKKFREDERVNF